ncbi:MAG: FAD-dependent oxidoreductase [Candidatus Pacebacteria bacterium]|nr:FAD-dependent oxidoreductase [Candidatus Paceibacterota bacterium]
MYDLIILGGGPAGTSSAVYAARKQLKTAIILSEFGGQSVVSETIYNWIGTPEISGSDLAESFKKHILYYKGPFLDVIDGEKVVSVIKDEKSFKIKTEAGKEFDTKTLIVATGSGRRKLEAVNADTFEHKGITYCASCDGPLFQNQDVLVIGGGNAGFETAAQLLAYCKSVTMVHRSQDFRADEITVKTVMSNSKFKAITNAEILRVDGNNFVESLTYRDKISGEEHTLKTSGIFVEIGQIPNTSFMEGVVELDNTGKIIVDPMTQMSSIPGIWAAGDCTNGKYHQNNIAAGDAVKALEDAYIWIHKNK